MGQRRRHLVPPADPELRAVFGAIRDEFAVPGPFPPPVLAQAQEAAAAVATAAVPGGRRDARDLPLVTIDPPGSLDLDQALCLERRGAGYRVWYAIADVPAFVAAGSALDLECRRRVLTTYLPDGRSPLHPPVLGEGAASLLPSVVRPAFLWRVDLDAEGVDVGHSVERAWVRSRERLDYAAVQARLDAGRAAAPYALLKEVGRARQAQELARGGASLTTPDQEVVGTDGRFVVRFRPPLPAEGWNAQISLLTGMAAAEMMLTGGIGILRTMPDPVPDSLDRFRRQVAALGVPWAPDVPYGAFLAGLDVDRGEHLALLHEATSLFRGAGYTPVAGQDRRELRHAAVAAPYAHVTAPLRRLVDRFALAVCASLASGVEPPGWAVEALPLLPELMRAGDRRAAAVDRACTDAVEAAELRHRVGEVFDAVVVEDRGAKGVTVQVREPAAVAPCEAGPALGARVRVRLIQADLASRTVRFAPA